VDFILFTDEKIFSVAAPTNLQNNRVYVPATMKKHETPAEQLLIVGLLLDVCLSYHVMCTASDGCYNTPFVAHIHDNAPDKHD